MNTTPLTSFTQSPTSLSHTQTATTSVWKLWTQLHASIESVFERNQISKLQSSTTRSVQRTPFEHYKGTATHSEEPSIFIPYAWIIRAIMWPSISSKLSPTSYLYHCKRRNALGEKVHNTEKFLSIWINKNGTTLYQYCAIYYTVCNNLCRYCNWNC